MDRGQPSLGAWRLAASAVQPLFFIAFPFIVWMAYTRFGTRALGTLLIALYAVAFLVRARGSFPELRDLARRHAPLIVLVLFAVVPGSATLLLFVPMFVSLYLLWTFSMTLRNGMPMIERFARAVEVDLPDFCVPYCRAVTKIWCVFLAANSIVVGSLALWAPMEWWALYTGLLFYLLMGALLGGEFVFRKIWFRYYGDGFSDRIFTKWFPPERTENGRRSLAYVKARAATPSAGIGAKC